MRALVFALMLVCVSVPVAAQEGDPLAARIVAQIAQADGLLAAGETDAALKVIFAANDLGLNENAMDPLVRFLPNLAAARAYRLRYDWAEAERYAAATLRALDGTDYALHPVRLEAAGRLGQALLRQGRASEAAAILRPVLAAVDAAGGVTTAEGALVEFWLGATVTRMGAPDWAEVGERVLRGRLHRVLVSLPEYVSFYYDLAELMRAQQGSDDALAEMTRQMAEMARDPSVLDLDRAAYLELHAQVLNDLGRNTEAAALMEAELANLVENRRGTQRYLAVGLRLALLWFELGRIDEGVAMLERMLEEALPDADPSALGFIMSVRGAALDHLGYAAEAQVAYREAYATLRQVLPAHAKQALETATAIRRDDPGFASFAFAAEVLDPTTVAPDGPVEAVLARFLSGLHTQNELVLMGPETLPEGADERAWVRNRVLHLALSGRRAAMLDDLALLRAAGGDAEPAQADQLLLYEAIGGFWLNGLRPQDAPALYAALDGLEMRLPPDQASLVRALRLAALNFDGRTPEAIARLRDWIEARDMARQPRTVWDIAAGMIATELGWLFLPRPLAAQVMADSLDELAALPGAVLARDYLQLVRLLNAGGDMETDRGLVELATLVQRVSAQVPEGHVLRASTRFGLANALSAQDRHAQAQALMAEAVEEYRTNPGHRRDVLAFMQSMQAQSLVRMGRSDLGLNLARAAYEALPADGRADYRMTIVMILAWELVNQGRQAEALALAEAELTDPALIAQLFPSTRFDLLRNRAGLYREAGDLAGSADLLAQAAALAADHPEIAPVFRAALYWDQGLTDLQAGRLAAAFRKIVASNDGYVQVRREVAQNSATGRAQMRAEDAMRARTEAMIGWELVKQLQPDTQAAAAVVAQER